MFKDRILLGILIPVLGIGILFSVLLTIFLAPPLVRLLKSQTDATLKHASVMGFRICEERFSDLLDLRLENDQEINSAYRKEALAEIKAISQQFPKIHVAIIDEEQSIVDASIDVPIARLKIPKLEKKESGIIAANFWGEPLKIYGQYFPFWRWHIVSFISEKDYIAPVLMAQRIVYLGTFSVLSVVLLAVLFFFLQRVNRPLKQIISATEEIAHGQLHTINVRRKDEIAQVALAFNAMVESLAKDKRQIKAILSELRVSEEQYRAITEHSLAYIAMVCKGRYTFANKMMLTALGYQYEDLIGRNFWEIVHPEDRGWVKAKIIALENGEVDTDHFECRWLNIDGVMLWLEILATLILYQEENAVLLHALNTTARKKAQAEQEKLEARLIRAEKMEAIGTLAGGVAHDLNNVLSGIVGYPDLLLTNLPQDSSLRKPIQTIRNSGEKAAAIVQDLLTLARRGVAVTKVVNLNQIISEYLQSSEYEKLKSFYPNFHIETLLEEKLLNIKGSPIHLSKTVMNLVCNAAEALPDGGVATISTSSRYIDKPVGDYDEVKEGDYVVLSIADKGIGISANDLEYIFEPFYTKKKMGRSGTGLGMTVVWGAIKDHHGYIDVQSTEGEGTTFTLYFPVTRNEIAKDELLLSIEDYKGNGESVLIVDDVAEQREIASGMLKKLGYTVTAVASGEDAVAHMQDNKADLIVLDMIMDPGINGCETYERINKIHPGQKAIIASGFSETESVKKTQEMGAGQYIKKPYILQKLGLTVRDELNK